MAVVSICRNSLATHITRTGTLFSIPEHGMFEMGRPAYVRALQGYASGTREGVLAFIGWQATACAQGAAAVPTPFVP